MKVDKFLRFFVFAILFAGGIDSFAAPSVKWTKISDVSKAYNGTLYSGPNTVTIDDINGSNYTTTNSCFQNTLTSNSGSLIMNCATSDYSDDYRVIVTKFKLEVTVPASTKITYSGTFSLATTISLNNIAVLWQRAGCELMDFGSDDVDLTKITFMSGADTYSDNQDAYYSTFDKKPISNHLKSFQNLVGTTGTSTMTFSKEFDNTSSNEETFTEYFVLFAYARHRESGLGAKSVSATLSFEPDTYTVTYDPNGGIVNPTSKTYAYGDKYKHPTPTRTGYEFEGWYKSDDTRVIYGAYVEASDLTLYAHWNPNTYTVTYDPKDGTVDPTSKQFTYGTTYSHPTPTRTGYTFNGWYKSDGTQVPDGSSVLSSDMTLEAHWTLNTYTVTYDPNGGTVNPTTKVYNFGDTYKHPTPYNYPDQGYEFGGWYKTDGTRVYYGDPVIEENLTFIAHWNPKTFTVTLKHKDGTEVQDQVTVTYKQKLPEASSLKPTWTGHKFLGYKRWDGVLFYDENMHPTDNVWDFAYGDNLEAQWELSSYTITVHAGAGAKIKTSTAAPSTLTYEYDSDGNPVTGTFPVTWSSNTNSTIKGIIPVKPGYVFCGWFTKVNNELGEMVYRVADMDQMNSLYGSGTYWSANDGSGSWCHEGNLDLYPEYRRIYTNNGNEVTFYARRYIVPECNSSDSRYDERYKGVPYYAVCSYDLKAALENEGNFNSAIDIIDMTTYMITINGGEQSLGDGGYSESAVDKVMQVVADYKNGVNSNKISINTLTYYNGGGTSNYPNACYHQGTGDDGAPMYQCDGRVVVTDKEPMTVKYQVKKASCDYDRVLSALGQKAKWGTLCLPFDIKTSATECDMNFYILQKVETASDGVNAGTMYFVPFKSNYLTTTFWEGNKYTEVIKANTPLIYNVEEAGSEIGIHQDGAWQLRMPVSAHVDQHTTEYEHPYGWELIGTRTNRYFHGTAYSGDESLSDFYLSNHPDLDAIYYISYDDSKYNEETGTYGMDVFSCLREQKNVYIPAYRAYFARKFVAGAKGMNYSLVVYDEDGNSTDITDLLDNENAEGDGKIYDLSGKRVKTPVKGHIYIVNGKKKVY